MTLDHTIDGIRYRYVCASDEHAPAGFQNFPEFHAHLQGHIKPARELPIQEETRPMTTEPETVALNQDAEAVIESYRGGRLQGSDGPRTYVTFSFDTRLHRRLIGLLAAHLKDKVTLRFGDIQIMLDDLEDSEDDDDGPASPPLPIFSHAVKNGAGDVILPHKFEPDPQDTIKCKRCELGEAHEVHKVFKEANGATADRLLDDAEADSRKAPATEEEAAAQAQAEENLRQRGKG